MHRPVAFIASPLRVNHSERTLHRAGRRFTTYQPLFSSQKSKSDADAFSKTLLLPRTPFPLWTDPRRDETRLRGKTCDELYRWQWENARGPLFVMHDGPPYANGHLHMGHALNKVAKDIINRYYVSRGYRVHYMPGWDCHGLPIENKALQDLGEDSCSLPPSAIRAAAKKTAEQQMQIQNEEFQRLGIMADWCSKGFTWRTLDHDYEMRQLNIFKKMVEKGLIYRHYRPVHYSPSSFSALAEAELIYKDDHVSHSVYVSYRLDLKAENMSNVLREVLVGTSQANLLVWTTTPWTLTANMGIAVHPELTYALLRRRGHPDNDVLIIAHERLSALAEIIGETDEVGQIRGADLVGLTYLPLFSPSEKSKAGNFKIIPASHVTSESGTGLVHCAPAHGAEDYFAFHALGLLTSDASTKDMVCHVDEAGRFTAKVSDVVGDVAAKTLIGQEVLKGGAKAIIKLLEHTGRLLKVQKIKHRYPYDWKTDQPIIVTATSQWFANLNEIKGSALDALQDVDFFPPTSRNRLEAFVRSRSEWCISRQRVWGVPIPALYHAPSDTAVLDSESLDHILKVLELHGSAYWWEGPVEEFLTPKLKAQWPPEEWRKSSDTMDVWFDSGTSWSMLRNVEGNEQDSGRKFLADICLEGSDQHRGWFQSQLLTSVGCAAEGERAVSPYGTLITHGMVLDEQGKKMSKSLGNIISPMTVVNGIQGNKSHPAYGADTLRLWAASVDYWRDMSIGPTVLGQAAESLRKIRNSARFILGNLGVSKFEPVAREQLGLADRYVMHELYNLEKTALEGYASYNFPKVVNSLTNFANTTLSSLYFDIAKDCLYANGLDSVERRAVVTVLEQVLNTITSVMAPIVPHLAEEVHETIYQSTHGESCPNSVFTKVWAPLSNDWIDTRAEDDMLNLLRIRNVVLSLLEQARRKRELKSSLEAEVDVIIPKQLVDELPLLQLLKREETLLATLFIVSDVRIIDLSAQRPSAWAYAENLSIPGSEADLIVSVRPATLEKCPRCWMFNRHDKDTLCDRCTSVVNPDNVR